MSIPYKALYTTTKVGDQEIGGYLMPDGEVRLSKKQVCEILGIAPKRLSQLLEKKVALTLMPQGLTVVRISTENAKIDSISIDDFCNFSTVALTSGYEKAIGFAGASMARTIEQSLLSEFGIIQTKTEANERFIARKDSILQRHFWTDSIKWYIEQHPELSDNSKKFLYPNVSNALNQALFGMSAKEIRILLDMSASENVRDCIAPSLLPDVAFIEKYAATRVKQGLEPMQAIREAVAFCNYSIRCPKTGQ
jgi:hypothetical protein